MRNVGKKMGLGGALIILLLGLSVAAWGQQTLQTMPFGTPIGNDAAKKMAVAAAAEAKKNGWPVCIAIVDYHGALVYFERLDNTQLGAVSVAVDKARTAAKFKRSTKVLEDAVASGRHAILRLGDATPIQGGLPIVIDGKFVGAIGVSGMASQQDEQVASAGLAALK
jgi:glc operon protein GlcG